MWVNGIRKRRVPGGSGGGGAMLGEASEVSGDDGFVCLYS